MKIEGVASPLLNRSPKFSAFDTKSARFPNAVLNSEPNTELNIELNSFPTVGVRVLL
ncbi:MAG: hypothetical protein BMS9Abin05_0953 [Rhodothermia bacterium]|nr:MAG: hypothetical protein BMS9Abin05_0953 [Rhodothermia bacterium]